MNRLRTWFIAGLLVVIPAAGTSYILVALFRTLDGLLGGHIADLVGRRVPGVGVAVTLALVLLAGVFATNWLGRRLIIGVERAMVRVPVVRSIYTTMKQVADVFLRKAEDSFAKVCLVEYPTKGIWAVGLLTAATSEEVCQRTGRNLVTVFIATTPNPTSGFLLFFPAEDVIILDMGIEEAIKLIVSAGLTGDSGTRR
ncbi:MAG: DUF502 domain-containing protein [Bacillota bacterium]